MAQRLHRAGKWSIGFLGAVLAGPATSSAAPVSAVDVSFDARASLFYYLECLAEGLSCSRDEVRALLTDVLGPAQTERAAADWAATMRKYAVQVRLKLPAGREWPDIGPDPTVTLNLRERVQDVMFSDGTPELLRAKLGVILSEADVQALDAIVDSVWPAFSKWWSGQEGGWRGYAARLEEILRAEAATALHSAERLFMQSAAGPLSVHLVPLSNSGPVNRATQTGRRSFVEFRPDDDPAARVAVIVHEYAHFLFQAAPPEQHRQRLEAFSAATEPSAASAFAVMNEVLATAIGNGLFMKSHLDPVRFETYASRSDSFYADPVIDRAAKAALPLVEEHSHSGGPFDGKFFSGYFRQMGAVFREEPADPRIALRVSQFYYTLDPLERLAIDAGNRHGFTSVYYDRWDPAGYRQTIGSRFEELPVAIIGTRADFLPALRFFVPGADVPTIAGVRASSCKSRREGGGWLFVFVVTPEQTGLELPGHIVDCFQGFHRQ